MVYRVIKTINGHRYYYDQWGSGNNKKYRYIGPVDKVDKVDKEVIEKKKGKVTDEIKHDIIDVYQKTDYGYTKTAEYIKDIYGIEISRATVRNIVKKAGIKKERVKKPKKVTKKEFEKEKRIKELEFELEKTKIELQSYKKVYGD